MKFGLILLMFAVTPLTVFAVCPQNHDDMECTISHTNGMPGVVLSQDVNFTVHSSTYLCDGKSNQFFFQEFPLDATYIASIFASFEGIRLSFYHVADTHRYSPLADLNGARAGGDRVESMQSLKHNYGDGQWMQIMCATVARN